MFVYIGERTDSERLCDLPKVKQLVRGSQFETDLRTPKYLKERVFNVMSLLIFYCCIANYHKLRASKSDLFALSSVDQKSQDCSTGLSAQFHSQAEFLSRGSAEKSTLPAHLVCLLNSVPCSWMP